MRQLIPPNMSNQPNDVLTKYEEIVSQYKTRAQTMGSGGSAPRVVPSNGKFYQSSTDFKVLGSRLAGFDQLFNTLINGVVDDPDYALRKDPQIYQRMLRDPQIYYCLMVRKTATSSLPWQVVPPDEFSEDAGAIKMAEDANARIKRIPQFREFLNSTLNALMTGVSINELIWKVNDDGQYVVSHHFPVDKDRFKFNKHGQLQLLKPTAPTTGELMPDHKFVIHRFQVRDGSWYRPGDAGYVFYGQGLADTPLYHYFYFKVTALRFMLKNLERNSSPFKVYYTGPQNAALASKLDQILAALQNDSVVGIPGVKGETDVQVEQARGGAELYTGLIDYVDRLITRAILGQELMTEMPAVGSYAAAQVHASVFAKITENDRDLLQDTLNSSLMKADASLNNPGVPETMRPVFRFKSNALVDTANFLNTVMQAQQLGLEISENQVRELSGLRAPQPHEAILTPPMMQQVGPDGQPMDPAADAKAGAGKPGQPKPNKPADQSKEAEIAVHSKKAMKQGEKNATKSKPKPTE